MPQELMDMIGRMGGADAIAAMAARVGITPDQANSAVAALVPALAGGMAKQAETGNGGLIDQLSGMAAAFTGSAASDQAVSHGTDILGHVFGSEDASAAVAQGVAAKTGIDVSQLAALMPMVATLAASALGNGTGTVASPAGGTAGGGIGGLLGGLFGGGAAGTAGTGGAAGALLAMIDKNKDGNPLDEIMAMASGFLKR